MKNSLLTVTLCAAMLWASVAVYAGKDSDKPVMIAEDTAVGVATVVAVDAETRKITLKDAEGDEVVTSVDRDGVAGGVAAVRDTKTDH